MRCMSGTIPTQEQIRLRAYELWEDQGRPWGTPETDWFRAEQELTGPQTELTQVAREIGAFVGSAVALLTDLTSGLTH
jgi:Protein of unknown function (DUF2934)